MLHYASYTFNILQLSSVLAILSFVWQQIFVKASVLWKLASYLLVIR